MDQVLSVVAVIDTAKPERWVHELVARLESRGCLSLCLLVDDSQGIDRNPDRTSADDGVNRERNPLDRLSNALLQRWLDRPRFTQYQPWEPDELKLCESTRVIRASDAELPVAECDVLINLCKASLPESLWPAGTTPVWEARLDTLNDRVEQTLLKRRPLSWLHLWSSQRQTEIAKTEIAQPVEPVESTAGRTVRRIASHALPRQSFSLSDLRRAAWFCLPSLFESRLVWLAHGLDPVDMEYHSLDPDGEGNVDQEVLAAHRQAERLPDSADTATRNFAIERLSDALALAWQQLLSRIVSRLWHEQWQLAVCHEGPDLFDRAMVADNGKPSLSSKLDPLCNGKVSDFTSIDSPDRTWWADPHLYRHEGQLHVFFEEMSIDDDHGHLSVARLGEDGSVHDVQTIMDEGQHLSYPFVFSDAASVYLIPETASSRSVQLFRAEEFPSRWVKVKNLLEDVNLADSTVMFDGERWWMFTNGMSHRCVDERDELHLYHATELDGPWQAHPLNPVVTGVDRARMAGAIIRDGGQLYRTSQYGAVRYGHGINLHRIDRLDLHGYAETTVGRLLPEPGSRWLGCHSTSHLDGTTIIDRISRRL